jgi:hypothetical protein
MTGIDTDLLLQRHRYVVVAVAAALPLAACAVLSTVRGSVTNATATLLLLGTAEIITLRHETSEMLIAQVAGQIREVLDIDGCRYLAGPVPDPQIPVLDHDGLLTRNGRNVNVDHNGLPTDDEIALLVRRGDKILGHFLLNAAARIARPTLEQRRVAVLLADQIGAVVDSHID